MSVMLEVCVAIGAKYSDTALPDSGSPDHSALREIDDSAKTNCIIAGVGGQGTVLAARLIGLAAMQTGQDVRGSETIGMAQRGGSVVSHVRMGKDIAAPLIPQGKAHLVIAFEPGEALRAARFLRTDGIMVVSDRAILPAVPGDYDPARALFWIAENIPGARLLSGDEILQKCGARGLNVALLGAACALGAFPFGMGAIEAAIRERLGEKYLEMNLHALRVGADMIQSNQQNGG
ncbi:MAG: indolepyruvate oxidoreductase subunit beta [Clostridiales Family XIII bacterium]|jgi:indolepyruvate ferredoxin oxidoreductase beta subunit|nr:indolepyruvate oxidoreductase subunit beta [Clostridiales Family XIII bacterium]